MGEGFGNIPIDSIAYFTSCQGGNPSRTSLKMSWKPSIIKCNSTFTVVILLKHIISTL